MQTEEQLNEITKISLAIYKKYAFLDRDSFDVLNKQAIERVNEQNVDDFDLYTTLFTEELYGLANKETVKLLSDPKSKKEYLNKYISMFISLKDTPEKNVLQLRKIARFFSFIDYHLSIDDVAIMLSNASLSNLISDVVENNLELIKKKGFNFVSKDPNIQLLLQSYCESNDIATFYDDYDYDGVYESSGKKLSIEVPRVPLLTKSEERELLLLAKSGDKAARNKLIVHNMRLALKIANRYRYIETIQVEDLFQTGCIGIHKAIEKFDLSTDFKFSTYASWWIKQSIARYCQDNISSIRRPIHISEAYSRMSYISNKLSMSLGRTPTLQELSDATGFPVKKLEDLIKENKVIVSLDSCLTEDGDTELYNFVFYDDENISDSIFTSQLRSKMIEMANKTYTGSHRERDMDIFVKRFGLSGMPPMKLEAIGAEYDITRERVRQISDKIVARIRKRRKELEPFINYDAELPKSSIIIEKDEPFTPTPDFYNYFTQFGIPKTKIYDALQRLPRIYISILIKKFNCADISKKMESYFIAIVPNIVHTIIDEKYIPAADTLDDIQLGAYKTEDEMIESLKKKKPEKENKAKSEPLKITPPTVFPYSLHDIVIVALRLGGVNGAVRSKQEIEEFLDEKYVPDNIEVLMRWVETRQAKDYYYLDEIDFQNFLRNRTLREITLVGLNFGYVTGYPVECGKIANFLDIDEDVIYREIGNTFIDYKGPNKPIIKERINRIRNVKKIGPLL